MKPGTYSLLIVISWVVFFLGLWGNLPFPWWLISLSVGAAAVNCTGDLWGNQAPEQKAEARSWKDWFVPLCWMVLLIIITNELPEYWAQICPLLSVIALHFASTVWPARKPENKRDVAVPQDVDREA
jgi:hypothetical protein